MVDRYQDPQHLDYLRRRKGVKEKEVGRGIESVRITWLPQDLERLQSSSWSWIQPTYQPNVSVSTTGSASPCLRSYISPGGSVVENPPAKQMWVPSLGQENSLEEETGQIPWTEELVGHSPGAHKEWDMTERLSTHTPKAIHRIRLIGWSRQYQLYILIHNLDLSIPDKLQPSTTALHVKAREFG